MVGVFGKPLADSGCKLSRSRARLCTDWTNGRTTAGCSLVVSRGDAPPACSRPHSGTHCRSRKVTTCDRSPSALSEHRAGAGRVSALLAVLAVLALIGANAFLVIGEYAVVTARRARLAPRAEGGSRGARAALRLMDDPVHATSTVQVEITAIGILIGAVAQPLVVDLFGDDVPGWLAFPIALLAVTYLSVVLGELVPKALTLDRAEDLLVAVAWPIELMARGCGRSSGCSRSRLSSCCGRSASAGWSRARGCAARTSCARSSTRRRVPA